MKKWKLVLFVLWGCAAFTIVSWLFFDYSIENNQLFGVLLIFILTIVAFYRQKIYSKALIVVLLLGLFNIVSFISVDFSVGFNSYINVQVLPFMLLLFCLLIYIDKRVL